MAKKIDMIGRKFGRWTILKQHDRYKYSSGRTEIRYLCRCDCGNESIVYGCSMRSGNSTSCGCYRDEVTSKRRYKHGHTVTTGPHRHSRTYNSWGGMIKRCTNPNCKDYPDYGKRGLTIAPEWFDFQTFLNDMGEKPEGYSLDRINVNEGYYPQNCKWSTPKEQAANRRIKTCSQTIAEIKAIYDEFKKNHFPLNDQVGAFVYLLEQHFSGVRPVEIRRAS